jgi:hypothetical protein
MAEVRGMAAGAGFTMVGVSLVLREFGQIRGLFQTIRRYRSMEREAGADRRDDREGVRSGRRG